jgi:hypothetical protein
MEKAHSAIQLYLSNEVLRKVVKENTASKLWLKLESLYMTKSLTNRLYLKKRLATLHMQMKVWLFIGTKAPPYI